ncbi:hypothetical protein PCASD_16260 [Puccinia coronata f. sp. avenae]|uniref:G-protein coupled receptors family 1 profile domain-containing protein n=1 Tax=Puccinia coronata f. sp. avenae TaxID=200324 RepID=A0A2N5TPV7_9BASI|nr:hypothetical protein PCASD_16260 [Puccinia coronata f. sp. avenae]
MLQFLSSSDSLSNEQIEFGHRLDAIAIGTTTCLASCMTGFITLKFLHFLTISDSKEQNLPRCLGSVALVIHMAQVAAQFENTWVAMTRFATSMPFNVFLYEGIETLFTLLIVIIVQIHFSRIVRAFIKNKKRWSICSAISCSMTSMAGLATSGIILSDLSHGRLQRDTPAKLSVQVTVCWAVWLSSATVFDITVLLMLAKHILKHRAGTVQISFKSSLSRILLVAVYAFLMTSLTSIVAIILIVVSTISPPDDFMLLSQLRIAAFVCNSFLPRIYLMAFCSSLVGKRKVLDKKSVRYSMPGPLEWA